MKKFHCFKDIYAEDPSRFVYKVGDGGPEIVQGDECEVEQDSQVTSPEIEKLRHRIEEKNAKITELEGRGVYDSVERAVSNDVDRTKSWLDGQAELISDYWGNVAEGTGDQYELVTTFWGEDIPKVVAEEYAELVEAKDDAVRDLKLLKTQVQKDLVVAGDWTWAKGVDVPMEFWNEVVTDAADLTTESTVAFAHAAKEHSYDIPMKFWGEVTSNAADWTSEVASNIGDVMVDSGVMAKDIYTYVIAPVGKAGVDKAVAMSDWAYENGVKLPVAFWSDVAESTGDWTKDTAIAFAEGVKKHGYELPVAFWQGVGEAGLEEAAVIGVAMKEHGYDLPLAFWKEVGSDIAEGGVAALDTAIGVGLVVKDHVVDIPVEFWLPIVDSAVSGTVDNALVILDTMIGLGLEGEGLIVGLGGKGIDAALATGSWCKEKGYNVPVAFWKEAGSDAADWTGEQAVAFGEFSKEYGYDVPIAFWQGVGEAGSEKALELAVLAKGKGYDLPVAFWSEAGNDMVNWTGDAVVAFAEGVQKNGYDIPKEYWTGAAEATAQAVVDFGLAAKERGYDIPVTFWKKKGVQGAEGVTELAVAAKERGYDLPKEFWDEVAQNTATWSGEEADTFVKWVDRKGVKADREVRKVYHAAKRRQKELEKSGREARTGNKKQVGREEVDQ